jgi:hypothetical protein
VSSHTTRLLQPFQTKKGDGATLSKDAFSFIKFYCSILCAFCQVYLKFARMIFVLLYGNFVPIGSVDQFSNS